MPQSDYPSDTYADESFSFRVIGRFADPVSFAAIWTALVELSVYQRTETHIWNFAGVWKVVGVGMVLALLWLIVPGTFLGERVARQFQIEER